MTIFFITDDDVDSCPIKVWFGKEDWECPKPQREYWLTVWARFLDSVASRMPKADQMFHISREVWVVEKLYDYYEEDELTQLTKFETKTEIFKIDLEEYL